MSKSTENKYGVMIYGKVVKFPDGTLLFSPTKKQAEKEMRDWVRIWRGRRGGPRCTAIRMEPADGTYYILKRGGIETGRLRVERLPEL